MTHRTITHVGLCSVTFRQLSAEKIVVLAKDAGIEGIEWGSDIHVPVGDIETARQTAALCHDNGLAIPSYGTYLRVGSGSKSQDLSDILNTSEALGAKNIRVWAGSKGSEQSYINERRIISSTLRDYASRAQDRGISLSVERHSGTLTDTISSCLALLDEVDHKNCFAYWQPRPGNSETVAEIDALSDKLSHLHVFNWLLSGERRALHEASKFWKAIFSAASQSADNFARYAFLEFTKNDDPQQFKDDARVLRGLVADLSLQRDSTGKVN